MVNRSRSTQLSECPTSGPSHRAGDSESGDLSSGQVAQGLQGGAVGDPRENDGGREKGEKSLSRGTPASPRLGEILQAGEGQHSLAPALRDDARETWQGSHVGQFVEGQEQPGALA